MTELERFTLVAALLELENEYRFDAQELESCENYEAAHGVAAAGDAIRAISEAYHRNADVTARILIEALPEDERREFESFAQAS